jgi:hypothetical protein
MSTKDETINIEGGSTVSSIQITINLGQPVSVTPRPFPNADAPPAGTLFRQVLPDPNDNTKNMVRITFVPDDSEQGITTNTKEWDVADKGKWTEFLDTQEDIDLGITLVRFSSTGDESGVATWLPDDHTKTSITHVFKENPQGSGGASWGDFYTCWKNEGYSASGFITCASALDVI